MSPGQFKAPQRCREAIYNVRNCRSIEAKYRINAKMLVFPSDMHRSLLIDVCCQRNMKKQLEISWANRAVDIITVTDGLHGKT